MANQKLSIVLGYLPEAIVIPISMCTTLSPTATVAIYLDKLHNSPTTLNNYAHFVAFADYESRPYFHAFKLLELSTNSSILGKHIHINWHYQDPSAGSQKIMEVGTIIGDRVYSVQYIADG